MADPRKSPSPSASAAASSPASAATTSPFVSDPGPRFEPNGDEPAPAPVAADEPALLELGWEEPQVRAGLEAQGSVLHQAVAIDKESDEWLYTRIDLAAIAPPLTRILNRYDATRAAAESGDHIALVIGLSGYVTRSYRSRRQALAEFAQLPDVPVSGVAAPAGSGPGTDTPVEPQLAAEIPDDERPHQWST